MEEDNNLRIVKNPGDSRGCRGERGEEGRGGFNQRRKEERGIDRCLR